VVARECPNVVRDAAGLLCDSRSALAGQTILILEDDPSVRTLLEKSLTARGYVVRSAEDGLAGLTALEGWTPDLLIVDVMMPRLDGMTFVRAIKGRNDTKPIPVIFLTAKNDPKSMIAGINLGARYYITKPFVVEELISKIQKALG
jgi:two-component system, OmpR family, response regulator MprA